MICFQFEMLSVNNKMTRQTFADSGEPLVLTSNYLATTDTEVAATTQPECRNTHTGHARAGGFWRSPS